MTPALQKKFHDTCVEIIRKTSTELPQDIIDAIEQGRSQEAKDSRGDYALGIIENKGRDNPSAIEEAKGAADLLRFNAGDKEKTANQLGWKPRELDNRLLLLNCAPEVQKAVIERHPHISIGHAELLAGLPQDRQVKVLAGILQQPIAREQMQKLLATGKTDLLDKFVSMRTRYAM